MLKKVKSVTKMKEKASKLKEAGVKEAAKISQIEDTSQVMGYIQNSAREVFQKIQSEGSECIDDEERFLRVVDAVHGRLPFQLKILIRKKRVIA